MQAGRPPLVSRVIDMTDLSAVVENPTMPTMKSILIAIAAAMLAAACCPTVAPEKPAYVAPAK